MSVNVCAFECGSACPTASEIHLNSPRKSSSWKEKKKKSVYFHHKNVALLKTGRNWWETSFTF